MRIHLFRALVIAAVVHAIVGDGLATEAGDRLQWHGLQLSQATGDLGRSSGTTGKGARQAPPIHCQWINGQKVCGSPGFTGPQTPIGPNFQKANPDADRTALGTERCRSHRSSGSQLIANARELAQTVYRGYDHEPILIARITNQVFSNYRGPVYLIAVSGTEPVNPGQATWFVQDLKAGFGLKSDPFRQNVLKALRAYRDGEGVAPGARLVLAGHSLGGMVAQNVAADIDVARTWPPYRVITFGSPKTIGDPSWLRIKRFGAYLLTPEKRPHIDFVTTLTPRGDSTRAQIWVDSGVRANEGFGGSIAPQDLLALHSSYPKADELTRYDALGDVIQSARSAQTLNLDPSSLEYCISPVLN